MEVPTGNPAIKRPPVMTSSIKPFAMRTGDCTGNAVPQDSNDGVLRAPAQGSGHEVGRWHEAVGILVMFIHA